MSVSEPVRFALVGCHQSDLVSTKVGSSLHMISQIEPDIFWEHSVVHSADRLLT